MRELCDHHGIVLIADEVMAGFGRCGEWFAIQRWDVTPDLITFAKGVNSGYVPLGGVIINDEIAATFDERVYPGGLTYSGHPLACASAVASINIFEDEGIVEHARTLGTDVIGPELAKLAERHPSVGEVRGLGVFWAVELVRDQETREPLVPYNAAGAAAAPMHEFAAACKERGLWPFMHFNRTHVVPPCTTTEAECARGWRPWTRPCRSRTAITVVTFSLLLDMTRIEGAPTIWACTRSRRGRTSASRNYSVCCRWGRTSASGSRWSMHSGSV